MLCKRNFLANNGLLTDYSVEESMKRPGYGVSFWGTILTQADGSNRSVGETGWSSQYGSYMWVDFEKNVGLIFVTRVYSETQRLIFEPRVNYLIHDAIRHGSKRSRGGSTRQQEVFEKEEGIVGKENCGINFWFFCF
eukprot:UN00131